MLVAVIGAGGHVSKYIVPELLKMGFAVRVLSRSGSHGNPNCEVFTGDALNPNDINNFLSDHQTYAGDRQPPETSPEPYIPQGLHGTTPTGRSNPPLLPPQRRFSSTRSIRRRI